MNSDTQSIVHHWREAVPDDRLAHLIRDTSRAFTKALQMRLAEHNVLFGHWTFLRVLWESDGLTQKELSAKAGVMEPTTFSAMQTMEALGYVVRKRLPTNKKNIYVHLTDEGRDLKKRLIPIAEETNRVSVEGIASADVKIVRTALLAMISNLAADEARQLHADTTHSPHANAPPSRSPDPAAGRTSAKSR